ncbi:DUF4373 domain-containing protein [Paenibacillus sp. D2_2]|uniref:DUF4373 domain-containing protein n=1 Tax=Paenibacillus sp. D2_2 TaxID=3073092 RepID=UPI0028153519|nr:DUF4373 domain-containing protein [Paenibacillus sp. D2_2]WMT42810.1 DUF4373 domain-containing protein [Paenibacillus sp. D2_2]
MKEAYYFSHDCNARHDPKMTAMRAAYGAEGYGWYWMLIEMMMESSDYKLDMQSKYTFNAFALQLQSETMQMQKFVQDCINEFELFVSDGQFFWSKSLLRRMEKRKKTSEKRSEAANKRWSNANASKSDANAMQNDAKESKGKESKVNENIKDICVSDESNKYDSEFENFWSAYPPKRKRDKAKTYKTWLKKTKSFDKVKMTECVERYAADKKTIGYDGSYAKMPTTFLNAETYKDYLTGGDGSESTGSSHGTSGKYTDFIIE